MSDKLREALAKGLLETNSPAPNCLTLRFTSQEEMTGAIAALAAEEESGWRLPATIQMPYRKMRADALVAEIMHRAVDKVLRERLLHGDEYGLRRYLSTALTVLFCESGIEVITDADRQAAGLERRNEHGLTPTELVIIENNRLMKMLEPVTITLPFPPSPKDKTP